MVTVLSANRKWRALWRRIKGGRNAQEEAFAEARAEAEEARWFEENQDRLLKLFEQAEKEGALRVGGKSVGITLSKNTESLQEPPSQQAMLRIPTDDLDRATRASQAEPRPASPSV